MANYYVIEWVFSMDKEGIVSGGADGARTRDPLRDRQVF